MLAKTILLNFGGINLPWEKSQDGNISTQESRVQFL